MIKIQIKSVFGKLLFEYEKDNNSIIYKIGRITRPDSFNDNIFEDCSHGIHFFVTKQEAIDW